MKKVGPYLSKRRWGTVREDYSADGNAWDCFSHDQAHSRAYRWGEYSLAPEFPTTRVCCASRWIKRHGSDHECRESRNPAHEVGRERSFPILNQSPWWQPVSVGILALIVGMASQQQTTQ